MLPPRNSFFLCLLGAILVGQSLAGCTKPQAAAPPPAGPREVGTVTVATEAIALTTELPGRTAPTLIAEIRPQVGGIIQKRLFSEGAEVKAGQILYQIDPAPYQAALDNAEASHLALRKGADRARATVEANLAEVAKLQATVELTQSNRQRFEDSYGDRSVSALQRDQAVTEAKVAAAGLAAAQAQVESNREAVAVAMANIQQAEAVLKTARINLAYCQVVAPISGRIGISTVTEGAIVTAYQPLALATIQRLDPIYVDIAQSTAELLQLKNRLKKGLLSKSEKEKNKVKLLLEDKQEYPQEGVLQFSDVTVDASTGSVRLRALFPNPEGLLLPGMFVRAVIQEGVNAQAILIPQQGVSRDPKGNPLAMLVDAESKSAPRKLTLDRALGDKWLVAAGLAPGDLLIVEGLMMLRPGTPVKASPAGASKEQSPPAAQPAASAK